MQGEAQEEPVGRVLCSPWKGCFIKSDISGLDASSLSILVIVFWEEPFIMKIRHSSFQYLTNVDIKIPPQTAQSLPSGMAQGLGARMGTRPVPVGLGLAPGPALGHCGPFTGMGEAEKCPMANC